MAEKGGKVNAPPGFFRLWVGRIFWGLVVTIPLTGFLLVIIMLAAEIQALDHARTGLSAANSLLMSAMKAGKPESVPMAVRHMADATKTTLVLFREDGTPAYSDTRGLDHIKAYTSIADQWMKAPHSSNVFPWPPSSFPSPLTHEVERIFTRASAHLLTDREGNASPLAIGGGFAVFTQAIPNRTSCARCHGFDREVLGHWVAVAKITPIATRKGTYFWGFWPLPGVNQQILFGGTASLALLSILIVSVVETWTLRRGLRGKKENGKKSSKKKQEERAEPLESTRDDNEAAAEMSVSYEGWEELHDRLKTLDQSILALGEEIPRAGVHPQKHADEVISVHATLGELLADWSDRFELDLQEIAFHPTLGKDPILARFLEKAQDLRSQAVSFSEMAVSDTEEKSFGALKAPFFESLSEDQQEWTDRLRAVLGHLHAEIRAMEGISKNGLTRTEAPRGEVTNES